MERDKKPSSDKEDRDEATVDADDTGMLENEREMAEIEIDRAIGVPKKK